MWTKAVLLGALVAVQDDDKWYREEITALSGHSAVITLGDWGRTVKKLVTHLRHLPDQFHLMPCQTIAVGLRGLRPIESAVYWSKTTREITRLFAEEQSGIMKIRKSVGGKAADVDLYLARASFIGYKEFKYELVAIGQAIETEELRRPFPSI
ncbi:hypothetical protein EAI_07238 [Harpegnathos saltator]|uniref:Tudor domain-containing protein n=1 Tax=Harpegnathos saltator TaxID=610380 RepID=E2BKY1_HARSA|nr:hypothetical protein EAI_07238 [Harpegnathos saltator]